MAIRAAARLRHSVTLAVLAAWPASQAQEAPSTLPQVRVSAERAAIGSLLQVPPAEAPVDVQVIGPVRLARPGVRTLATALQDDPAIGENYAATGYYENFTLRGFTLDLGASYRINGLVVPGEMHIALDNKEAVEVLRGTGHLAGGSVGPGGTINFITRRPADVRSARIEQGLQGGTYLAADIGRAPGIDSRVGWQLNIAHEEMRPPEQHAAGHRDALALALDIRAGSASRLAIDAEYGRRTQPAVPGLQLLGGTVLPDADPRININQQPWSRPVRNESRLLSARGVHDVTPELRLRWGASDARVRIDDSLAFPFGCNSAPNHFFCADGGYVLYDYRALERRRTTHVVASLEGESRWGTLRHEWDLGVESVRRTIGQDSLYSTTLYDADGLALSGNLRSVGEPLPPPPATGTAAQGRVAVQQGVYLSQQLAWGRWRLWLAGRSVRIRQTGAGITERLLPQLALSWQPGPGETFFVNAARGLEFGVEAPVAAQNAGALLPPREIGQMEAGWRRQWPQGSELAATLYRMNKPFLFTQPLGSSWAGLGDFVQHGKQVHIGGEVNSRLALARSLEAGLQAAALRAVASGTGEPTLEGRQLQNVARLRASAWIAPVPQRAPGARAELRWLHVGARSARPDGAARVPGYDRIDASLRWPLRDGVRLQATVENLFDRHYWRDAGAAYGADLLFPGRPRAATVGVVADFR